MSASQNPRKRIAFTDIDRQCLRVYNKCNPGLTPLQLASWFESEFGRKVSNSSVYDILSDKYTYLDDAEATEAVRKSKGPQWAELETALFEWWQSVQPCDVTGKELKARANEIWHTLPTCHGKKPPTFSDGWLSNWRVRHGLGQSSKRMDSEQISSDLEVMGGKVMVDSAVFHRQSIAPSPYVGLMFRTAIPAFVQRIESTLHFDHQSFQSSSNKTHLCSQYFPLLHSATNPYRAINSPHRGKQEPENGSPAEHARHRPKRAKLMVGGQTDTVGFQLVQPCPISAPSTTTFRKTPWHGVQELFSVCNALNTHSQIIAGDTVKSLLRPIFNSLEVSGLTARQEHLARSYVEKAILLFDMAENFQLQQNEDESKTVILEEWFLDTINPKVLRSRSPERSPSNEKSSSSCNLATMIPSRRAEGLNSLTNLTSSTAESGRVSISTRNFRDLCAANGDEPTQHLRAKIVITPPAISGAMPLTEIHLAARTWARKTSLSTPSISFRNIVPMGSPVFKIAAYGTSLELQLILSKGEASLLDCDPAGRSLINYALQSCNCSTLKFLITKVDDIDAFEPTYDDGKDIAPLIKLLGGYLTLHSDIRKRDAILECLRLMLLTDADLLLEAPGSTNTLVYTVVFGTAVSDLTKFDLNGSEQVQAAVRAILNSGLPYLTNDHSIAETNEDLLLLAEVYSFLSYLSLHVHEKIFLFLERGTDITVRGLYGRTSLHFVFETDGAISKYQFLAYQEEEFKDILMCMVTTGADVYASDDEGTTISQVACRHGHEVLWREVLAECGYDPDEVFSIEDDFSPYDLRYVSGLGIFQATAPVVRPTRLSFAEYSRQRKSLQCVQNLYSREIEDFAAKEMEAFEFWKSYIESSDSEDSDWMSVESNDEASDDDQEL